MRVTSSLMLLLALTLPGCAAGGTGSMSDGGPGRDSGDEPPGNDGGRRDASLRDSGSETECPTGQHACGGGCIDDLPNDPANGCRLGCGEPCLTPTSGTASCSSGGSCTFACTPPYHAMGDTCVCTPFTCEDMGWTCGSPDDGCGNPLDCGSCGGRECIDGRCACAPDSHEPDDGSAGAPSYGTLNDADDPPDVVLSDHNLDDDADVDWMRFSITDGSDFGNPRLTVTLDNVPIGSSFELSAFYSCSGGSDASTCAAGVVDNELGHGCTAAATSSTSTVEIATECDHLSTDDSGTLFVRVRAASWADACAPYRITLRVR